MILRKAMHVLRIERPVRPVPYWLDKRAEGDLTRHDGDLNGIAIRSYSRSFKINKKNEGRPTLLLLFYGGFSAATPTACMVAPPSLASSSSC